MKWKLLNATGDAIAPVFSFRMEQSKSKPATLRWTMPVSNSINTDKVTLWNHDTCVFQGYVYKTPTHIQGNLATWVAVALDPNFQAQLQSLMDELNSTSLLEGNIKDCVGGQVGYVHIDPVTHKVEWVSLEEPTQIWDTQGLHEPDSLYITPFDSSLTGISASVKITTQREERGMMDVGPYITSRLSHGIETYSGVALESEWKHLAFRALRAGYDIQRADLTPLAYERADLPKILTLKGPKEDIVSIPYHAYKVQLLLSWSLPVTTHTTLQISIGDNFETLGLTLKNPKIDQHTVLNESLKWMKAYSVIRSFTSHVKARIPLNDRLSVVDLSTRSWVSLHDPRIQSTAIQGPILSYAIIHDGNNLWVEFSQMWAPDKPLTIPTSFKVKAVKGEAITGPKTPEEVVAHVDLKNNALEQYGYYASNKSKPFEDFSAEFPMTQLDIALNPVLTNSTEYLEQHYELIDS